MRTVALLLLASTLLFAASDADAKGKKKKHAPKAKSAEVMTGDPIPSKPVVNPACRDQGAVRIIGEGPATPFAIVKNGKVSEAGMACCAQWARKGTRWKTVDAFGAVVGEAEISGGEGYDVSQCYELSFTKKKGSMGVGLYLDGDYAAPKSAAWTPNDAEKNSLAKIVSSLEAAMVPNAVWDCGKIPGIKPLKPLADRALFFTMPNDNSTATVKWAVVGGPILVMARIQSDGKWVARHVESYGADACQHRAYEPRAVFDIDGDGRPEVFLHFDWGDSFGDQMLTLGQAGFEGRWIEVAQSVGGSTA